MNWREECLHRLTRPGLTEQEVFAELSAMVRALGFEYCSYVLRIPFPLHKPVTTAESTYPENWLQRYFSKDYLSIDPTIRRAMTDPAPFVWTPELFAGVPDFWEEAQAHGVRHGWGVATQGFSQSMGMLSVARSAQALDGAELTQIEPRLVWLSHVAHGVLSKLFVPRETGLVELTAREIEVLKWTAIGKTAAEIGTILNLSERTVNFHITNSLVKLDAINKTQAVVKAVVLGLLP